MCIYVYCNISQYQSFKIKYYGSILYQRGIYPPEEFERVMKYGCPIMVTTDKKLKEYIRNVLEQISGIIYY